MTANDSYSAAPLPLNYFNYFTEIEDAFVRRRKKHLFLSPLDWALMETWKAQGIPLHIVLRGVERAFDSFEAKPRKRSVKSLLYCQEEVEAQFAEWLEARVGAHEEPPPESDDSTTVFSLTAVLEHLRRCRDSIEAAIKAQQQTNSNLAETLARTATRLVEIESEVDCGAAFNSRKIEDSLTGLERMLNDSMFTTASSSQLDAIKAEVKSQLRPYRNQMDSTAYEQTANNLTLKRLREQFSVPRLSLFYL